MKRIESKKRERKIRRKKKKTFHFKKIKTFSLMSRRKKVEKRSKSGSSSVVKKLNLNFSISGTFITHS